MLNGTSALSLAADRLAQRRSAHEAAELYARAEAAEQAELDTRLRQIGGWLYDPTGFATECIDWPDGQSLTPYQDEVLAAVPRRRRVAVRGPHGLGKTTEKAIAILWFAITREIAGIDWKVPTTAGAWRQLEKYLWPEVHKWARRLRWDVLGRDPFDARELQTLALKLPHGQAFAVASDDPALIEGVHADSVLYVFDEAKAIASPVWDAAEGAFSAGGGNDGLPEAFALAGSTPGAPVGRFYEIHSRKAGLEDWWTRHVTVDEAVAAGRVSREWVDARARQWGEASAVYANRVLGEFHADDEDGVIPLAWVEAAVDRWRAWDEAGRPDPGPLTEVGVDVARSGADETVLALRHGDVFTEIRRTRLEDTMVTTGRVAGVLEGAGAGRAQVDVIGIGAGVYDRLREQGFDVEAFNASEATKMKDRSGEFGFTNVRSAAWWNLREMLDPAYDPTLAFPDDELLIGDLTAPRWRITSGGKIQVESKDDIKKRLGRSPDSGDGVMQACWPGTPAPTRPKLTHVGRVARRPGPRRVDVA